MFCFSFVMAALLSPSLLESAPHETVVIAADGQELSTKLTQAIARMSGGGTIVLDAGEHIVARPFDPGGVDRVTIQGRGAATVVRFHREYFGSDDRWIMNVTDQHDHWTLRDFVFDGNAQFSPEVCDRDKIVKLRGDHFTIERVVVRNEAGRGFATILGDDQRWLNCTFENIGTNAGDSSVVHPGNRDYHARRVLVSGCMGDLGPHKVTFVDAVASDLLVSNNAIRGGKTGVILSWWTSQAENAVIANNILLSSGRSCRLNRKKPGEFRSVVVTGNVLTGPLENQFGSGFVDVGNTLRPPAKKRRD